MLVRSVIYGWGFDFMRPFHKMNPIQTDGVCFISKVGFERSNATVRWTVAGDGWTEPILNFRLAEMQANPSFSAIK